MKKEKAIKRLAECANSRRLCRVEMKYGEEMLCVPLDVSDKFFIGAAVYDFMIDGWVIRRVGRIDRIRSKSDKISAICEAEGLCRRAADPKVNLTSWRSVFRSIRAMNRNVIIEHENSEKSELYIGRIEAVKKRGVCLRYFDSEGVWDEEPIEIPYYRITGVTFGTRYLEIFSKYLPKA